MTSPYDPEAVAKAMAGGVVGTLAALREENARLRAEVERRKNWHPPDCEAVAWKEVERLRGLILDWDGDGDSPSADAIYAEKSRIRAALRGEKPCTCASILDLGNGQEGHKTGCPALAPEVK